MILKRIKIKGFRSFDNEIGLELTKINNMNLIIGQNNVGKSNVFRAFRRIISNLPDGLNGYHQKITKEHLLKDIFNPELNLEEVRKEFEGLISIKFVMKKGKLNFIDFWDTNFREFTVELEYNDAIMLNFKCVLKDDETSEMILTAYREGSPEHISNVVEHLISLVTSTLIIDEVRSYDTSTSPWAQDNGDLLTDNFSLYLKEQYFDTNLNQKTTTEIEEYNEFLEKTLSEILLNDYSISIDDNIRSFNDFNPSEHILVQSKNKKNSPPVKLKDSGTGIGHILLLVAIVSSYKRDLIILLEEPEHHLHPEAMVRLIQYLYKIDQGKISLQFIINTHTPWLIDNEIVDQIYLFQLNENGSTFLHERFEKNKNNIRELLDLLGVRPSQFLQSNLVIWVEGPSDRIYIKKWLKLLIDEKVKNKEMDDIGGLTEGKHYSFFMYAGSLLKYYSYDQEETESNTESNNDTFINLLSTSRYSILVCDTDNIDGELKNAVKKWLGILQKEENKKYVLLWRTYGKEIENYLTESTLFKILSTLRSYVKVKCEDLDIDIGQEELHIPIELKNPAEEKKHLKKGENFAEFFSGLVQYNVESINIQDEQDKKKAIDKLEEKKIMHEGKLISKHKGSVKRTYNSAKVNIASTYILECNKIPNEARKDLERLLVHILNANRIEHNIKINHT